MADTSSRSEKNDLLIQDALDYFVAGVPALGYFELQVDELVKIVKDYRPSTLSALNSAAELCVIGLSAYFEAFCKAQFAALVNICPRLLTNFVERRRDAMVSLNHILEMQAEIGSRMGSIVAEGYDFGSAKEINGLFYDLARITPFSTDECVKFGRFLSDRNLLVHHGGVYTLRYFTQNLKQVNAKKLAHWDSLVVHKKEFDEWKDFLLLVARKTSKSSKNALERFVVAEKIDLTDEQKRAVEFLGETSESE
jgi:hypothetical protein